MSLRNLRIIFMGTPDFAVESLKTLVENKYNVVGVITSPDRKAGRGQKISESAVKRYAVSQDLPVLQPEKFKNSEFLEELKALNANLQIVVAFRMLPEVVWAMPEYGTFNLHASLLPQYRGAAPINWAIINGEKETGITTFFIEKEIDTGNILFQKKVKIKKRETAGTLHDKLMMKGSKLVLKTVKAIEENDYSQISQIELIGENKLKPAHKIFKPDCKIDWNNSAKTIYNFVRGLSPYPCAWTELTLPEGKNVSFKIYHIEILDKKKYPFGISTDNKTYFHIETPKGKLAIHEFQPAGKRRMTTEDFLKGNNLDAYCLVI